MQKKLLTILNTYWRSVKDHAKAKLERQKHRTVLAIYQLLADLITNAAIVIGMLFVIFLTSITLSFALSIFFGSHVMGFLAATLCLTLAALMIVWKRHFVERYFAGLTIVRYFEKREEQHKRG